MHYPSEATQEIQARLYWGSCCSRVPSLGREDPLQKRVATHSRILAWKIPWTQEPGGLQSIGSHRVGHDWSDLALTTALQKCQLGLGFCFVSFCIFLYIVCPSYTFWQASHSGKLHMLISSRSWCWTREAWRFAVHGVTKSQTQLSGWAELSWAELNTCSQLFFPLWSLCILLLRETFVQAQALEQRVPGPRSQPVSNGFKELTELLVFCPQMPVVRYLPLRSCVPEGKD